jgi:putative transposase
MNKTYQFRLYPTKKQQAVLSEWLALCCEVYNAALQERRDAYRMAGVSLGFAQQCAELPDCKRVRPELAHISSQVLQDVVKRVDLAFAAFFRRREEGEQPGYPRFRSRSRYGSLTFKQYRNSFEVQGGERRKGRLILSKLGHIKMVMHRPLMGLPKTATVKRTTTGKWFVSISVQAEQEADLAPPSDEQVGIDVGLKTFAYLSRWRADRTSSVLQR